MDYFEVVSASWNRPKLSPRRLVQRCLAQLLRSAGLSGPSFASRKQWWNPQKLSSPQTPERPQLFRTFLGVKKVLRDFFSYWKVLWLLLVRASTSSAWRCCQLCSSSWLLLGVYACLCYVRRWQCVNGSKRREDLAGSHRSNNKLLAADPPKILYLLLHDCWLKFLLHQGFQPNLQIFFGNVHLDNVSRKGFQLPTGTKLEHLRLEGQDVSDRSRSGWKMLEASTILGHHSTAIWSFGDMTHVLRNVIYTIL